MTMVSKRMTRKRKLQVADCEQSELNSKWIKEFKSEYVRSKETDDKETPKPATEEDKARPV